MSTDIFEEREIHCPALALALGFRAAVDTSSRSKWEGLDEEGWPVPDPTRKGKKQNPRSKDHCGKSYVGPGIRRSQWHLQQSSDFKEQQLEVVRLMLQKGADPSASGEQYNDEGSGGWSSGGKQKPIIPLEIAPEGPLKRLLQRYAASEPAGGSKRG